MLRCLVDLAEMIADLYHCAKQKGRMGILKVLALALRDLDVNRALSHKCGVARLLSLRAPFGLPSAGCLTSFGCHGDRGAASRGAASRTTPSLRLAVPENHSAIRPF